MNWNFLLKRSNFLQLQNFVYTPTPGCYIEKMLFARSLTHQPDNYLQFAKVGTRKGMDVIWALDAI